MLFTSLPNITYFTASLNSNKRLFLSCKKSLKTSLPGSCILTLLRAGRYQLSLAALFSASIFPPGELNRKIYLQTSGKVVADHAWPECHRMALLVLKINSPPKISIGSIKFTFWSIYIIVYFILFNSQILDCPSHTCCNVFQSFTYCEDRLTGF